MLTPSQYYWQGVVRFTFGGKTFRTTRRMKSWLLMLEKELKAKHPNANGPGRPAYIRIYQGPYNTSVAASAGTHDKGEVIDCWIVGLTGSEGQAFLRWKGSAAFWRKPGQGPWDHHYHLALIPPGIPTNSPSVEQIAAAYKKRGLEVGKYVPRQVYDYYHRKNAMAGHGPDTSPRPSNIGATVFRPKGY